MEAILEREPLATRKETTERISVRVVAILRRGFGKATRNGGFLGRDGWWCSHSHDVLHLFPPISNGKLTSLELLCESFLFLGVDKSGVLAINEGRGEKREESVSSRVRAV